MKNILFFLAIVTTILVTFSCGKGILTPEERFVKDTETIDDYLSENNLTVDTTLANGLRAIIEEPGTGGHPMSTTKVKVAYKGYLPNGTVFDESAADGIEFRLNQVIEGWTVGIPLFQKGGKGVLLIPSHLAYGGSSPSSLIPSHSVLIFDVELLSF